MNKMRILFYSACLVLYSNQVYATDNVILTKGSDTLLVVAQAWAEAYDRVKPEITVSVGGGGSGTGFDALLKGLVDIANSSRPIDTFELERAARLRISPVERTVGYDALAVYIHRDNPLSTITFKQLEDIFGKNAELKHWTDLGIEVPGCECQRIVRVSSKQLRNLYLLP
jgi:phosphate transport system substrate-binding protein